MVGVGTGQIPCIGALLHGYAREVAYPNPIRIGYGYAIDMCWIRFWPYPKKLDTYWRRYAYRTRLGQIGYGPTPQLRRGGSAGQGNGGCGCAEATSAAGAPGISTSAPWSRASWWGRGCAEAASSAGKPGISTSAPRSRASRWGRDCLLWPRRHGSRWDLGERRTERLGRPGAMEGGREG